MSTTDDVRHAVEVAFPADKRQQVLAALQRYNIGPEKARVQRAILVLAEGNVGEVERLVAAANVDYRDLLYWAEYPEESGSGTKADLAARYRSLGLPVPSVLS